MTISPLWIPAGILVLALVFAAGYWWAWLGWRSAVSEVEYDGALVRLAIERHMLRSPRYPRPRQPIGELKDAAAVLTGQVEKLDQMRGGPGLPSDWWNPDSEYGRRLRGAAHESRAKGGT